MESSRWRILLISLAAIVTAVTSGAWGLSARDVDAAMERAEETLRAERAAALHAARTRRDVSEGGRAAGCPYASMRHQHSRRATKQAAEHSEVARLFEETTKELLRSLSDSNEESWREDEVERLEAVNLDSTALSGFCPLTSVTCNASKKYREADGTCNNLQNPGWGSAASCMNRLLPAAYQDGVSSPRVAANGSALPNARKISYTVHPNTSHPATNITHLVMQFGQFLDHDFALAPLMPDPGEIINLGNPNNVIDCCSPGKRNASNCFSIDLFPDDPFFGQFGQTCMNLPRSAACTRCTLGQRQQQDILTSYIDTSQIYGSSQADTLRLRSMSGGRLKNQYYIFAGELLPRSFHVNEDRCSNPSNRQYCFRAGDERANEHPGLTAVHTTFLRHHNRIAGQLFLSNIFLSDEQLFQRTKRIVECQFQHIVFSEWLPIILGPAAMSRFGLTPLSSGFTTYNASIDATMLNEFAAAAFRLGHTLIDGTFHADRLLSSTTFELQNNYFFPFEFYNGFLEPVLRGLMQQRAQTFDRDVTDGVTNHLYRLRNESFGLDLIALNLQRAREHGVRPYVDYFYFCTGVNLTSFDALKQYVDNDVVELYKVLYNNVRDIDLFTASISEFSVAGGIVGPTFACILGHMFQRLKYGDRFFYEHQGQAGSLTAAQLAQIRRITLAKIICENTGVDLVSPNVFRPNGPGNQQTFCFLLPDTNSGPWA
ncbi:salivary peroxidase/catechol oxidase-like isoform X2 [Amblyomma americanum]